MLLNLRVVLTRESQDTVFFPLWDTDTLYFTISE